MSSTQHQKKQKKESWLVRKRRLAAEMTKQHPHFKSINNLLGIYFVAGMSFLVWEMFIYDNTIVPLYIPFTVCIGSGMAITPLMRKTLNSYLLNPFNPGYLPVIWQVIYNVASTGSNVVFLFMALNFYFPRGYPYSTTAGIENYGHYANSRNGCGKAYVNIRINNEEKKIEFPRNTPVETYNTVNLLIEKGLFGFEIIEKESLDKTKW